MFGLSLLRRRLGLQTMSPALPSPSHQIRMAVRPQRCNTCMGDGEIITDWEGHLFPPEGAQSADFVAPCRDCAGQGTV